MNRPLNQIAASILTDWGPEAHRPKTQKAYHIYAMPYVQAMLQLRKITDYYGLDDGEDIVLRFLSNASMWRGPVAKQVKEELKLHLKEKTK